LAIYDFLLVLYSDFIDLDGTIVELSAAKFSRTIIFKKKKKQNHAACCGVFKEPVSLRDTAENIVCLNCT